jgi:alpha-tubulin suppressor-like RCC1 family protein
MTKQPRLSTLVAALTGALAVAGGTFGMAAAAGAQTTSPTVKYWGTSDGGVFRVKKPTTAPLSGTIKQVATSNGAWYALTSDGAVWAWGAGQHGQLGDGHTANTLKPVKVSFPSGVKIAFLADVSPYDTALAVDSTGQAWGWGLNSDGQLCKGNTTLMSKPVKLPLSGVTALSGAGDHALYVSHGTLYSCGNNRHGDLGTGTTTPSHVPVAVPLSGVTAVTSSWGNSGAVAGGSYYSWGYNALGGVGDGSTTDATTPTKISLPASVTFARLGGGGAKNGQTLVLLSDGTMWAWGADTYGQLRDGKTTNEPTPEKVATPAPYVALESNGETSYGIDASGKLWGWGSNRHHQLGISATGNQLTPLALATGAQQVSATAGDAEVLF